MLWADLDLTATIQISSQWPLEMPFFKSSDLIEIPRKSARNREITQI